MKSLFWKLTDEKRIHKFATMKIWLQNALDHAGLNQPQLAQKLTERLGRSFLKSTVNKILVGKRSLKADEIVAISAITGYPMPDANYQDLRRAIVAKARYVGIAAPNLWFDKSMFSNQKNSFEIPCVPGQFSDLDQFAYRIHGSTMEKDRIFDGSFVVCVAYWEARAKLLAGDTVIVERSRDHELEISCRKLMRGKKGFELWSQPIEPFPDAAIQVLSDGSLAAEDGTTGKIVGLVIGVYSPR